MSVAAAINSHDAIQTRLSSGYIPRYGPMLMLVARSTFILVAQGFTLLILLHLGVRNASVVIRNWWPVYGTLVDLGCLGLLIWLTRQEGIRLFDLVGLVKSKLKTEIPLGLGLFLLIFPVTMFGGGLLSQWLVYGKINPEFPQYTFMRVLPLWALLYARILWWPIWSAKACGDPIVRDPAAVVVVKLSAVRRQGPVVDAKGKSACSRRHRSWKSPFCW